MGKDKKNRSNELHKTYSGLQPNYGDGTGSRKHRRKKLTSKKGGKIV